MRSEKEIRDLLQHWKTKEPDLVAKGITTILELILEGSESPDMERIMKEAYQREKLDQRLKNRKPIKDNPDADIISEPSIDDYPEGTDEGWVENAKRSCEATIKGAEEAVKIMKEDKQFPYTDIIHPNSTGTHITVDGEDGIKYTFPNPEKMKVTWLPERAFTPDREEDVKIVYDENISAIAISICEQLKLTESETGMFVAGFEECNKYLKNIVDKNEWRDASKEQPEDGVVVLNENCTKVFYQREKLYKYATPNCWFMNYEDGIVAIEVKYWMPLPEKPKFV